MATIRICNVDGCQRKHVARGFCMRHYNATPAARAAQARYDATPAARAAHARYNATPEARAARARYSQTPAGKAAHRAAQARYSQTPAAKEREQGLSETPQALGGRSVSDLPQPVWRRIGELSCGMW